MNKSLSISQVNRLYLACMLLVASLGAWLQSVSFSWGLLLTEILLILAPTIWLFRHNQVDLQTYTNIKKTRSSLILVAVILGAGAWMVTSMVEQLMVSVTGYIPPTPSGIIPTTLLQALLIFLGFVIAAPICEEILFRGTIQQTYQNHTTVSLSILLPSLLFAFFHFRLQGLPALLITALLLGFTYWRTNSLTFTMVVHAANNFVAFVVLIREGLFPHIEISFPSTSASAFGILMLVAGLVLLQRFLPRPQINQKSAPAKFFSTNNFWPIFLAAILFSVFAVQEVFAGIQQKQLTLRHENLPVSAQWKYEIQHKGGEPIGVAECQWHTSELTLNLSCQKEYQAFELQTEGSFYSSAAMNSRLTVEWLPENLTLSNLFQENITEFYTSSWQTEKGENDLILHIQTKDASIEPFHFSPATLVQEEWAWRLMGASFENQKHSSADFLTPLIWRDETEDNGPVVKEEKILVTGPESIQVPAGEFQAWKVSLSNGESAWYATEEDHRLLRFDSNMVNYLLVEAN